MNGTILKIFAVAFLFAAVEALQCYKCSIGFWNLCITTKTTCNAGEHCYSGRGKAAGFVDVMMKGCLAEDKCNKTEDVDFGTSSDNKTLYTMTKTCCNTDLCNGAPAGLPGVVQLTLASFIAVFTANTLI